jgi:hypothetical protein
MQIQPKCSIWTFSTVSSDNLKNCRTQKKRHDQPRKGGYRPNKGLGFEPQAKISCRKLQGIFKLLAKVLSCGMQFELQGILISSKGLL